MYYYKMNYCPINSKRDICDDEYNYYKMDIIKGNIY